MEVPKEVVEVLKNAQVKLQDCLDCVYEERDPNERDGSPKTRRRDLSGAQTGAVLARR